MRKKYKRNMTIQLSILLFILIAAALSTWTAAWYSSTVVNSDNIFATGKLEIKVPDLPISSGIVDVNNIYPGWLQSKDITITNSGSIDFFYKMYVDPSNLTGNVLYDGRTPLKIKIVRNGSTVKDFTNINNLGYIELGDIDKNSSDNLTIAMKLPEEAQNEYQGKSAGINFIFEARQKTSDTITAPQKTISVGKKGGTDYSSIQDAVNAASDNDIIRVEPGYYAENVVINKPLTLLGAQSDITAFTRSGSEVTLRSMSSAESYIIPSSDSAITLTGRGTFGVTIKGFRFENVRGSCITCSNSLTDVKILNNLFIKTEKSSINFASVDHSNVAISGNAFNLWRDITVSSTDELRTMINLSGGKNITTTISNNFIGTIGNNNLPQGTQGIVMDMGSNSNISNNIIDNLNWYGIRMSGGENDITCSGNTISNTYMALHISTSGPGDMSNTLISNNILKNSRCRSIFLTRSSVSGALPGTIELKIENNSITQNPGQLTSDSGAVWICMDPRYTRPHGSVRIIGNNISFTGSSSAPATAYGLVLLGNINVVDVLDNTLDGGGKVKTGIYIMKTDGTFGTIPDSAKINIRNKSIEGFETPLKDTR